MRSMVGPLQRLEAQQDVGGLTQRQAEVAPLERDVGEADERTARGLLGARPGRIDRDARQRHAPLHPALHLDERKLHVDRGRQLRLGQLELLELDDLARFGARGTRGTIGGQRGTIRHVSILGQDGRDGQDGQEQSAPSLPACPALPPFLPIRT